MSNQSTVKTLSFTFADVGSGGSFHALMHSSSVPGRGIHPSYTSVPCQVHNRQRLISFNPLSKVCSLLS